jgi:hypothetical protein
MSRVIVNGLKARSEGEQARGADQGRDRSEALLRRGRQTVRGGQVAGASAASSLARGRRGRVPAAVIRTALESEPHPGPGPGAGARAARPAQRGRVGRRTGHDPHPPAGRGAPDRPYNGVAHPDPRREGHPATSEATQELAAAVRRGPAEPDVAVRLHPLDPHHRQRGGDHRLARTTPATCCTSVRTVA